MIEGKVKLIQTDGPKVKRRAGLLSARSAAWFFVLFAFWLALSPSFSLLKLFLGVLSSFLVVFIIESLFASVSPGKVHIGVFARLPFFILVVIWEIIKANIDVGRIVIDPKLPIDPRIFAYRSRLRGDWEKTLFTYFVNLTPGTVVLDIRDDIYYIHGLAPHHQDGMNEGNQEKMVAWLFGYKLEETAEKSP
jgi:multicomponent Na+:H+ antiporter subunit E